MDLSQLTPRRPYLLRAFYEWLLDNQLTPHGGGCDAPACRFLWNMRVTANRTQHCAACCRQSGTGEDDEVRFNARFGGIPRQVSVPLAAVLAIYARENGAGTMFEPEAAYDEDASIMNDEEASATTKPLCRLSMATSQITMMKLILTMNLRSHHAVVDRHYAL